MNFPNPSLTKPPPTRLDPVEFDPNDNHDQPWASYCPTRPGAKFKLHALRRHAISAISTHGYGILFVWNGIKWVESINWPNQSLGPPRNCDGCGNNMWHTSKWSPNGYNVGSTRWVKKGGQYSEPVYVCSMCK